MQAIRDKFLSSRNITPWKENVMPSFGELCISCNFKIKLSTNHKPLEWLTFILDANGQRGSWISMLQDFHFKIIYKLGNKHTYVDALS
jgi:hypothetical protein